MATQTTVVNESKPGNWLIYWELRGIPAQTNAEMLRTNRFTCGEKIYEVKFVMFENHLKKCNVLLRIKTTKGNDK